MNSRNPKVDLEEKVRLYLQVASHDLRATTWANFKVNSFELSLLRSKKIKSSFIHSFIGPRVRYVSEQDMLEPHSLFSVQSFWSLLVFFL